MHHAEGVSIATAIILVVLLRWWRRTTTHPYAPCLFCRERHGRSRGSKPTSYGKCFWCKGSRERLKFVSWLRHRYGKAGR